MKKVLRIIALVSGIISVVAATILGIIYLEQFISRVSGYANKLEKRLTDRSEPLPELEEICALPGIDMIFFGPADFSQGIGSPLGGDPRIDEARRLIAKTARKYGKFAGTVGGPGNFDQLVEMGYTFISTGADVVALTKYFKDIASQVSGRDIAEV